MEVSLDINNSEDEYLNKERSMKFLLWMGIVSMVMLFAGLTSGYIVRKHTGNWVEFRLPQLFWVSTAIIITSSVTMNWALSAAKKNNLKQIKIAMATTLFLGLCFVVSQFAAWHVLVKEQIFFAGSHSSASGSFLYVLSGLHLAHLIGGIICVLVVLIKSIMEKYNAERHLGLKLCAIYWHFLDGLWVYLFLFLLFIR